MTRHEQPQSPEAAQIDPDQDYCYDPRHDKPCALPCVACDEDGCDSEEPKESTEPEEGDITTEDHQRFYQYGRLILNLDGTADHIAALREHMEDSQFWPNVWFISDHGNAHLIDMSEERS